MSSIIVRPARTPDVPAMIDLLDVYVGRRILLGKELVDLYGALQEFQVAESEGQIVGMGALHIMWEDLGEIRTLAAAEDWRGCGVGHAILVALEAEAWARGLKRLFCLTFEVGFFGKHGFSDMGEEGVDRAVYEELLRSHDEGVAEFLDLARVKQNTLGNTRMLKVLEG